MAGRLILGPSYASVKQAIDAEFQSPHRTRMLARLLENQALDTWMTYELMGEAIKWVQDKKPIEIEWEVDEKIQTYNQGSSTTADMLNLKNTNVDSFFNFQTIRVDGGNAKAARHVNRPDGMFLLKLNSKSKGPQPMVLFYEGDVHGKDVGKTQTEGCRNSHKMYQAIAQAQSKNEDMAGCVIFAAMQHAPTDKLLPFLDDMLKAHIFVCIAIADWNSHIQEAKRVTTLIGSLFGNALHHNTLYDFVFGINIGLEEGVSSFNTADFEHRITTMLQAVQVVGDIELTAAINGQAPYRSKSTQIGCVKIVICAIPRPKADILKVGRASPMFIYPLNIREKVNFIDGRATVTQNDFANFLTFNAGTVVPNCNFKKNMMRVTAVYINNPAVPPDNSCNLRDTNGFFYIALPLAYYTIQQFEVVNAALNYRWSPTEYDFRQLLRAFKANQKKLTGDLQVTMFKKNKGSLFHTICESVDDLPPLRKDFEIFLQDCCRWREDETPLKGSSPKIIFRTLGIFSLQNAIDFACDIRANPNKTYSSLLASYPAGAQILIQQCMKKLSGNEAYAYIGRDDENDANKSQVDEQGDSDDDDIHPVSKKILQLEDAIRSKLFHSTWKVEIGETPANAEQPSGTPPTTSNSAAAAAGATPASASVKPTRIQVLALQLLDAYQKSVVKWKLRALNLVDATTNTEGETPSPALSKILAKILTENQFMPDTTNIIDLTVEAHVYDCNKDYQIKCVPDKIIYEVKYVCTPEFPKTLEFASDIAIVEDTLGTKYTATWGAVPITFILESRSVPESAMQGVQSVWSKLADTFNSWVYENTIDGGGVLLQAMEEAKQQIQAEKAAAEQQAQEPVQAGLVDGAFAAADAIRAQQPAPRAN